ncbi:MAG TPA: sulfite exporter TauE/SafE family protein [Usitatibacteraceae bacterium]|nr:sulfite exporter TauE/SafE family protein [Usitatibacteraceae bacterium]
MNELSQMPLVFWFVAPVTILFAYTVFGMSGFGSTIIAVPILANWLPLTYLVPLMALGDLVAAIAVGGSNRRHVSVPELKRLLPFMIAGIVLGVTVLVNVPQQPLKVAAAVFAMSVGLHSILDPAPKGTISPWWCVPAGTFAGALAAVFGAGGPVNVAYLAGRLRDKGEIRSTVSVIISVSATIRTTLYALAGLVLKAGTLAGFAMAVPFAWAGLALGSRIHVGLTQAQMRRAIGGILMASGTVLLARTLLA